MKCQQITIIICICLNFVLINQAIASKVMVTNSTGSQFTVSWVTEKNCIGKVMLYDHNMSFIGTFTDDRDPYFIGDTHHVSITGLSCNSDYVFSIVSGDRKDDNNGQFYVASTGNNMLPTGSFQPAGQVFSKDTKTVATNAIVYIVVSNGESQTSPLSCIVDQNGYWFTELVNARTEDNQHLFSVSTSSMLNIRIEGGKMGSFLLESEAKDNNGGKSLYEPVILR